MILFNIFLFKKIPTKKYQISVKFNKVYEMSDRKVINF
jgi:hypothetical protein